MKSGKCPKCNQRNISRCRSEAPTLHMPSPEKSYLPRKMEIPAQTFIYACNECRYTETYLSDSDLKGPLHSHVGWEQVSGPSQGPFR
jgi:predicted nucleic-acid-binding Zn-ribbon protein